MTTSEQWSLISHMHTGPSAGAFRLSTPIQGLNQSFCRRREMSRALKPHGLCCRFYKCYDKNYFTHYLTKQFYLYFADYFLHMDKQTLNFAL